jgi:Transposase DDE domain
VGARWTSEPCGIGYEVSQRKRKRVEQSFGWMKMIRMLKKVKLRGIDKVGWLFTFTGAAYNLHRSRNLMASHMKRSFDFGHTVNRAT